MYRLATFQLKDLILKFVVNVHLHSHRYEIKHVEMQFVQEMFSQSKIANVLIARLADLNGEVKFSYNFFIL
jgi:hypothetical protein